MHLIKQCHSVRQSKTEEMRGAYRHCMAFLIPSPRSSWVLCKGRNPRGLCPFREEQRRIIFSHECHQVVQYLTQTSSESSGNRHFLNGSWAEREPDKMEVYNSLTIIEPLRQGDYLVRNSTSIRCSQLKFCNSLYSNFNAYFISSGLCVLCVRNFTFLCTHMCQVLPPGPFLTFQRSILLMLGRGCISHGSFMCGRGSASGLPRKPLVEGK